MCLGDAITGREPGRTLALARRRHRAILEATGGQNSALHLILKYKLLAKSCHLRKQQHNVRVSFSAPTERTEACPLVYPCVL